MLTRREAIATLTCLTARAASKSLTPIIGDLPGAALLIDVPHRTLIAAHAPDLAATLLVPPGSTIKPFTLEALLAANKLRANDSYPCPGALSIGGHQLNCTHPPVSAPIQLRAALAYSCNCFVAHFADRLAPGGLATHLRRRGLASTTGWFDREGAGNIARASTSDARRLQALGEDGILVTPAGLAAAYLHLAVSATEDIRAGLEQAVEFGTAQQAAVPQIRVAGKTGSVRASGGTRIAWFAGFAPSRSPSVVVTVMVQAKSGGADAAPVAARILDAHFSGRL